MQGVRWRLPPITLDLRGSRDLNIRIESHRVLVSTDFGLDGVAANDKLG
jgi:hypothetical protein